MNALDVPFADGNPQAWQGMSLKTSPLSNVSLHNEARHICTRPQPVAPASARVPAELAGVGRGGRRPWPTTRPVTERTPLDGRLQTLGQLKTRAPVNHGAHWPDHVEQQAVANGALVSLCLVPRGRIFENYVHDPVEPRRSGLYEFCVVGVDASGPGPVRYHCWEPTGHHDRLFSSDEVEQRFAVQRHGRSVSLPSRAHASTHQAHRKDVQHGLKAVVRWPDGSSTEGLMHGKMLPEVDERGRAILPQGCRFPPRNSADLLDAMICRWSRTFLRGASPKRIMVLDHSGRFASRVQQEFLDADVLALDDPPRLKAAALKAFRDRSDFPVCEDGSFDRKAPSLKYPDGSFDAIVMPFTLHRLCDADERRFLALVLEALRVSSGYVLLAEDLVAPISDESALRRWKVALQGECSAPVLLEGDLKSGSVPDHYLSASNVADCPRRFLVLRSCKTSRTDGFGELQPGEPVDVCTGPHTHWRPGVVTSTAPDRVRVRQTGRPSDDDRHVHVGREAEVLLATGTLRRAEPREMPRVPRRPRIFDGRPRSPASEEVALGT